MASLPHPLCKGDPRVDSECYIATKWPLHELAGIIRKCWFQYKKMEVILAYLRCVH